MLLWVIDFDLVFGATTTGVGAAGVDGGARTAGDGLNYIFILAAATGATGIHRAARRLDALSASALTTARRQGSLALREGAKVQERRRQGAGERSVWSTAGLEASRQHFPADASEGGEGVVVALASKRLVFAACFAGQLPGSFGSLALAEAARVHSVRALGSRGVGLGECLGACDVLRV